MKKLLFFLLFATNLPFLGAQDLKTLLQLTDEYYNAGGYLLALEWAEKAQKQLPETNKDNIAERLKLKKAQILNRLTRYGEANKILMTVEPELKKLGENSNYFHAVLNEYAYLNRELHQYEKSENYYKKLLSLKRKYASSDSIPLSAVYNNFGILYYMQLIDLKDKTEKDKNSELQNKVYVVGNKSKLFFEKSLDIKKNNNIKNLSYTNTLNNLANLYIKLGEIDKGGNLLKSCLEIKEELVGKTHVSYVLSQVNLGIYYAKKKQYIKAKELLDEAEPIMKYKYGEEHPIYNDLMFDYAEMYHKQKMWVQAELYYLKVTKHLLKSIKNYFPFMNENEKINFYKKAKLKLEQFDAFAVVRLKQNHKLKAILYNLHLQTKGLLLNSQSNLKNRILASNDKNLITTYGEWTKKKEELANLSYLTKSQLSDLKIDLNKMNLEIDALEKKLSTMSKNFLDDKKDQAYTWRDVYRNLQLGEYAIEIIKFHSYNDGEMKPEYNYGALIMQKSNRNTISFVELPNGNKFENRYLTYYRNCIRYKITDYKSYIRYWAPITKYVKNSKRIFVSPEGVYNQLNINVLYDTTNKKHLIENYNINYVTKTSDIINFSRDTNTKFTINSTILFGRPDYHITANKITDISNTDNSSSSRFSSMIRGANISDLPGTETEVLSIKDALKSEKSDIKIDVFLHEQATEDALKKVNSPTILHIATHGFFINSSDTNNYSGDLNPMLRSGLLLAGVTNYFKDHQNMENDGILTAYEAANLQLSNTEIVVLSACETGLGEILSGEGVFGMQRAINLAGAKAILMSHWKVDDEATKNLMITFYRSWIKTGDKQLAFRNAQIELMNKYNNPYYWGAFVMVGE